MNQAAAFDFYAQGVGHWERRAGLNFDPFGGALADQELMFFPHVGRDRGVHFITGYGYGSAVDGVRERDDGDVGDACTNIDNHVAARFLDRESSPLRGGKRLVDEEHVGSSGISEGLDDCPPLHLRQLSGDRDGHLQAAKREGGPCPMKEAVQHAFAQREVGDHPTTNWLHRAELLRCAAHAGLRPASGRFNLTRAGTDRHEGWLFDGNTLTVDVDESVGRAQVETNTYAAEGADHDGIPLAGGVWRELIGTGVPRTT